MFMQVVVWGDREAQLRGWDSLEDTSYADDIIKDQIHMPAVSDEQDDAEEREEVEGVAFTGYIGSFIRDRLYDAQVTLIRAADGTVWVDYDTYQNAVL